MKSSIFKQVQFCNPDILVGGPVAVFESVGQYSSAEIDKMARAMQLECIESKFDGRWKVSCFVAKNYLHVHSHPDDENATVELDDQTSLHITFYDESDAARFKLNSY